MNDLMILLVGKCTYFVQKGSYRVYTVPKMINIESLDPQSLIWPIGTQHRDNRTILLVLTNYSS